MALPESFPQAKFPQALLAFQSQALFLLRVWVLPLVQLLVLFLLPEPKSQLL